MSDLFTWSDTRLDAHQVIQPRAATLRDKALSALKSYGPMTADEIAGVLGESILAIRPRITELAQKGFIEDTGKREKNVSGRAAAVMRIKHDA